MADQVHKPMNVGALLGAVWLVVIAQLLFENWAALRPQQGYYDELTPAMKMAVDAVGEVLAALKR